MHLNMSGDQVNKIDSPEYYTPSIEEFHVGFEFEVRLLDGYWNPGEWEKQSILKVGTGHENKMFTLAWIHEMFEGDISGYIRVKRLDADDIKELGWSKVLANTAEDGHYRMGGVFSVLMWHDARTNKCIISFNNKSQNLFFGTILNLSELRFQMKRLGITK